ncbi:VCBS repeat-containing protein [Mariprofundus ferrooxydans]|nr:VCBS repeat-containing protein [Mariprofundus ferrooxydans]
MKFKLLIAGGLLSLGLAGQANAAFFVDTYDHVSSKGSIYDVTVGDFDHDGDIDFAIHYQNFDRNTEIETWFNNGSGGFMQGSVITTNFGAYSSVGYLNYADLSGDGEKDLIISGNKLSGAVDLLVFTGDGIGGFGGSVNVINIGVPNSVGYTPDWNYSLVDMNNDGKMDILLHGRSYLDIVTANINQGGGVFTQVVNDYNALTSVFVPASAALSNGNDAILDVSQDITGDGFVDMVVVSVNYKYPSATELIQVLAGDGLGGFTHLATTVMGTAMDTGISHGSIKVGDVNNDGIKDVVYSYERTSYIYTSAEIRVVLGLGNGSFSTTPTVLTGTGSDLGLTLNDIDADGDLDIVSPALSQSPSVGVMLNNGTGSFFSPQTTNLPSYKASSYRIADFDGNGLNDILVGTKAASFETLQFNVLLNGVTSSAQPQVAADNNALGADAAGGGCISSAPMTLNVLLMLLFISLVARYRKAS